MTIIIIIDIIIIIIDTAARLAPATSRLTTHRTFWSARPTALATPSTISPR